VLCSVVIPSYNRADFLPACVESVRRSGLQQAEIVLVDDGSTDETPEVVRRLGPGIRYLYQPNGGEASARNVGIRHSRGRYVAFLDSDDQWLSGGHQALVEFLEQHPEVKVGFGDALIGSAKADYRSMSATFGHDGFRPQTLRELPGGFRVLDGRAMFCYLTHRIGISVCTFVVRRTALLAAGGFDETIRLGVDWELWLRLALRHVFVYYDRSLATYHRHSSNISRLVGAELGAGESVRLLKRLLAKEPSLAPDERACLESGLADRLQGWGYVAFDRGDYALARARCAESLRLRKARPRAWFYWLASWMPPRMIRALRTVKQRAQSGEPAPSSLRDNTRA
jgi:glycosyltransferase involved in cell wall biosynthesis